MVVDGPAADGGGVADDVADGLVAVVGRVVVCGTVGGGGEWRSEWIDEWNDEWIDEWNDEWNDQLNHQLNQLNQSNQSNQSNHIRSHGKPAAR